MTQVVCHVNKIEELTAQIDATATPALEPQVTRLLAQPANHGLPTPTAADPANPHPSSASPQSSSPRASAGIDSLTTSSPSLPFAVTSAVSSRPDTVQTVAENVSAELGSDELGWGREEAKADKAEEPGMWLEEVCV